jgi:hypothetical protein
MFIFKSSKKTSVRPPKVLQHRSCPGLVLLNRHGQVRTNLAGEPTAGGGRFKHVDHAAILAAGRHHNPFRGAALDMLLSFRSRWMKVRSSTTVEVMHIDLVAVTENGTHPLVSPPLWLIVFGIILKKGQGASFPAARYA